MFYKPDAHIRFYTPSKHICLQLVKANQALPDFLKQIPIIQAASEQSPDVAEDDNPPVGILLCTDKGETMVKYATTELEHNVFVHKYQLALPSKEELGNI